MSVSNEIDFAQNLIEIIEKSRSNALKKVNSEYTIETVYKQYKEIWNKVKEDDK